jgi:YesN/AraC family two-component response regulator
MLIHILYYIAPENYYFKIIFSIFDLIAIYWVSVNGVIQQNVLSLLAKNESGISLQYASPLETDQRKITNSEDLKTLMEEIDSYMQSTEIFLNRELTIIDLAEKLNIHPKKISACINTIFDQNFNSYVNELRIKKAEDLLSDQSLSYFSIEGISKEVGFHSKSAFYAAFKKVTGTTPNKYKEKLSA